MSRFPAERSRIRVHLVARCSFPRRLRFSRHQGLVAVLDCTLSALRLMLRRVSPSRCVERNWPNLRPHTNDGQPLFQYTVHSPSLVFVRSTELSQLPPSLVIADVCASGRPRRIPSPTVTSTRRRRRPLFVGPFSATLPFHWKLLLPYVNKPRRNTHRSADYPEAAGHR